MRYIPRELEPLLVAGKLRPARRSRLWVLGAAMTAVGLVGVVAGPILSAEGIGGSLRWLWIAAPPAFSRLAHGCSGRR